MFSIISSDGVELNMEYMHPGIVLTSRCVGDNRGLSLVETDHVTYILASHWLSARVPMWVITSEVLTFEETDMSLHC